MADQREMQEKISFLQHLMGNKEGESDFISPSLLREVPSFTSTDTQPTKGEADIAKLWARSE